MKIRLVSISLLIGLTAACGNATVDKPSTPLKSKVTASATADPADSAPCFAFADAAQNVMDMFNDIKQSKKSSPFILAVITNDAAKNIRTASVAASPTLSASMMRTAGSLDLFAKKANAHTSETLNLTTETNAVLDNMGTVLAICATE